MSSTSSVPVPANQSDPPLPMSTFKTYMDLEEYKIEVEVSKTMEPKYLPGEVTVASGNNVLLHLSSSKGIPGSLHITNARIIFVSSDHVCSQDSIQLLGIHSILCYETSKNAPNAKKSKKKIVLGNTCFSPPPSIIAANMKIHEIVVVCCNFRTLLFSFKFSQLDAGLKVANALIHHAFPARIDRLFYFDYCGAILQKHGENSMYSLNEHEQLILEKLKRCVPTYLEKSDWIKEVRNCNELYRLCTVNEGFELCGSLPEFFAVPNKIDDVRLRSLAYKLKGGRPPFWTFIDPSGAAILRMGKFNNEEESGAENAFFEAIRNQHPSSTEPHIHDLDTILTVKEIRGSFSRIVELFCPYSSSQYEESDSKFLSNLEQTKWPLLISRVLNLSHEIAKRMCTLNTVEVFQEKESRDTSCLLSSVIQLVISTKFRTTTGFFQLLQKEWIASGHQFHSEYMHASPVFLLFLDCVYQLQLQNPHEFEFNEQLLIEVWDSCFEATTSTFLFDEPRERKQRQKTTTLDAWLRILAGNVSPKSEVIIPDSCEDKNSGSVLVPKHLLNPFYVLNSMLNPNKSSNFSFSPIFCSGIMCYIDVWQALYFHRNCSASLGPVSSNSNDSTNSPGGLRVPGNQIRGQKTGKMKKKKPSVSLSDYEESPSSPMHMKSFIYGEDASTCIIASVKSGRNYNFEVNFVETLGNSDSVSEQCHLPKEHPSASPERTPLLKNQISYSNSGTRHNPFMKGGA